MRSPDRTKCRGWQDPVEVLQLEQLGEHAPADQVVLQPAQGNQTRQEAAGTRSR